jgi:hypothetical protein
MQTRANSGSNETTGQLRLAIHLFLSRDQDIQTPVGILNYVRFGDNSAIRSI